MNDPIDQIKKAISNYIEVDDLEWADYAQDFNLKSVKKKELILQQGRICNTIFFVRKGLLRVFFVDADGEEKTFHFSMENTFSADYESFLKKKPSNYSIQTLEDSELILMPFEMLHRGYEILKNGEKLGRLLAEEYFFLFSSKIHAIYTQSPMDRYNQLNKAFPNLLQRVPQHYIASFLNISPVHLSRLKNQSA